MRRRVVVAMVGLAVCGTLASAAPPVTDPSTPSPAQEAARRWIVAAFQAPLLERCNEAVPRSEAARMLGTVLRGEQLRAGAGWYGSAQTRFDWKWLAERFDANRDGRISKREMESAADFFSRLDRDRDGAVTPEDLDWSERSPWVKQEAHALRLFRQIDGNGNGRISEAEMQAYFQKLAGEKGFIRPDELRDAMGFEPAKGAGAKTKRVTEEVWNRSMMEGDIGSPFEGPRPGQVAPDFTLPSQDGTKSVTLSAFRGKQPVVLIFGSFT